MLHTLRVITVFGCMLLLISIVDPSLLSMTPLQLWSTSELNVALTGIGASLLMVWAVPVAALPQFSCSQLGPPLFEDVGVRAAALEITIVLSYQSLLVHYLGIPMSKGLEELVLSWQVLGAGAAVASLAVAVLGGALRHFYGLMLSQACPFAYCDSSTNPHARTRLSYVGDVASEYWMWSPWFRAGSWTVVSSASLIGALIIATIVGPLTSMRFNHIALLVLFLRWVCSAAVAQWTYSRFAASRRAYFASRH